jgi:hypothetical protein
MEITSQNTKLIPTRHRNRNTVFTPISCLLLLLAQLIIIMNSCKVMIVQARHVAAFATAPGSKGAGAGATRGFASIAERHLSTIDSLHSRSGSLAKSYFTTQASLRKCTRRFSTSVNVKPDNAGPDSAPFIDDNVADPSSYAIPAFQQGDDMLTDLPKGTRIVSFGDVHGDILALYKFLQASQLLHPKSTITNPIWDGGDSILVQCGDILDRGAEELFCLRYLTSLARQAPKQGGRVLLLHGNHEALNANGLFNYADRRGNEEIEVVLGKALDAKRSDGSERWRIQYGGNEPSRWAAFEPNGWLAEPLYSNMNVVAVVGRTVFVHAGLTKVHMTSYGGIESMNQAARDWFVQEYPEELRNDDGFRFQTVQEVIDNANLRGRLASKTMPACLGGGSGAAAPVWMRDYSDPGDSTPKSPQAQKMIDDCLNEVGHDVQRMVMGHTPQSQINAALKGKAWRVDVGASRGVNNGTPEVLEIIHKGGENDEDVINILTIEGDRIPSSDRQIGDNAKEFW